MDTAPTGLHVLKFVRISRRHHQSVAVVAAEQTGSSKVLQESIILPSHVKAPSATDRERLWTLADLAEKRSDANLATLWEGHLPTLLSSVEIRRLANAFGQYLADYLSAAVEPVKVLALCSAREVGPRGFRLKNRFGLSTAQRIKRGFPTSPRTELLELRAAWASLCDAARPEKVLSKKVGE